MKRELVESFEDYPFNIATHSPILMAYPGARLILLDGSGLTEVSYEDTEHYTATKDFLNNHEKMVNHLFEDGDT